MKHLLYGLGLGAGLMYVLDPESGTKRRERIRERTREALDRMGPAAQGMLNSAEDQVRRTGERVGETMRHAGDPWGGDEGDRFDGEGEGGNGRGRAHIAGRVLAGAAGGALAYYGLRKRGMIGTSVGTLGLGLLTYGATERNVTRLIRSAKGGQERFEMQKSMHVNAPVEEVFQFWSRYENFADFMTHIKEVQDLGAGRSRWIASGPAGIPVEWEAVVRDRIPNELIRWESTPESAMRTSGEVRFQRSGTGTDVHVTLSYQPPAGKLGKTVAEMFGADPQKSMEEDLEKVKPMLERS